MSAPEKRAFDFKLPLGIHIKGWPHDGGYSQQVYVWTRWGTIHLSIHRKRKLIVGNGKPRKPGTVALHD